jgi:hypothetical protein
MSSKLIAIAAEERFFHPRKRFHELASDHIPFDRLLGGDRFEARALRECVERESLVGVLGPRGGGKSSLIACVCANLPKTHVPLRIPVAVVDDPTSIEVIATVALDRALSEIELDDSQRENLEHARADTVTTERTPGGIADWKLGGAQIPVEVHYELQTLRQQLQTAPGPSGRFAGLDRLITILVSRGIRPVLVLEDTEAALGGVELARVEGFLGGPVRAIATELDAALLIAIQDVFVGVEQFEALGATMARVEIPELDAGQTQSALVAIAEDRLRANGHERGSARDLLDDDVLGELVAFYVDAGRNMRATLSVLQSATDVAAEDGAELIAAGHLRASAEDWRRERGSYERMRLPSSV